MAFNYAPFQGLATKLVSNFGLPLTVSRAGASVGSGYGIFTKNNARLDTQPGLQLGAEARTLMVSGMGKAIEVSDVIAIDNSKYSVTSVSITAPVKTIICYNCEVVPWLG